jgi:hypothetical protein
LNATIDVYNLESRLVIHRTAVVNLSPTEVINSFSLAEDLSRQKGVSLILLKLTDRTGKSISSNGYWLSGNNDFKSLNNMPL